MTRLTSLLVRKEQFAGASTPVPLGVPSAQVLLATCLEHRVDPSIILGLKLGEAPVIRNARGAAHRPTSVTSPSSPSSSSATKARL
jgi:carbonic anhydrase